MKSISFYHALRCRKLGTHFGKKKVSVNESFNSLTPELKLEYLFFNNQLTKPELAFFRALTRIKSSVNVLFSSSNSIFHSSNSVSGQLLTTNALGGVSGQLLTTNAFGECK